MTFTVEEKKKVEEMMAVCKDMFGDLPEAEWIRDCHCTSCMGSCEGHGVDAGW